jgi:hypothetical protein
MGCYAEVPDTSPPGFTTVVVRRGVTRQLAAEARATRYVSNTQEKMTA